MTPVAERICNYCKLTFNTSVIEDEKRFLYECSLYVVLPKKYLGDLALVGDVFIDVSHVCDSEIATVYIYHEMNKRASAMLL